MHVNKSLRLAMAFAFSCCAVGLALSQSVPAFSSQPLQPQIVPALTPAPALKYRDPTKLITIGEISDLQAAKAQAEFASKFGYTGQKAATEKPSSALKIIPPTVRLNVLVLAAWSKSNKAQAEAIVDGRFATLTGGETLAPGVKVEQVLPAMLVLSVEIPASKSTKGRKQPSEFKRYSLRVGAQTEIEL
jgi:hypothetical protein